MPIVKAIFFDIGDTLVFDNPPLRERLAIALHAVGLAVDKARLPEAFRIGEAYAVGRYVEGVPWEDPDALGETVLRILATLELPPPDLSQFFACFAAIPFERFVHRDALALLAELNARGFRVGAISDWETTLPALLAELGIAHYLDALAVSDSVGVTKPNPRLFAEALRQAGAAPETSLHIGDWYELDVAGARIAGMQTLLFDWPGRRPKADCPRVTTFDELTAYLRALPKPL